MIYIVRHGQTNYNLEKRITGRIDISLNSQGIKDALKAKEELKDISFDYVFVSPLKRTIETAKIITNNNLIIDERLIERSNGELEGKKKDEIPQNVDFNLLNESNYGLEPVIEVRKRVNSFLNDIKEKYPKKNILIVTHGGVIINMRYYFEGEPNDGNYDNYISKNGYILKYNN